MTSVSKLSPALSVIVVTYNSAGIVSSALAPLVGRDGVEVIVVDNNSTDETVKRVRTLHPGIVVVQSSVNGGFATGVNQGIARATGSVVLLLNPDAVVEWPDVQRCLKVFEDDPTVGVVAPQTVQPDGRQAILEAGRAPNLWRCFTHASGLSRAPLGWHRLEGLYVFPNQAHGRRTVDWVSGCCMFVRHSVLQSVGGLTERWFMYAEDIEFCLRVGDAGHRVVVESSAEVIHQIGASSAPDSSTPSVNSAWLVNLYELYCLRYRPGVVRALAWKCVAVFWMLSRAASYRRRSRRAPRGGIDWLAESRKFVVFSSDVWRAKAS